MRNLKILIQYDGTRYKGWQRQKENSPTIQEKIESVLSKMTGEEIQVIGCGRTDSGVHAENYVANFRTNSNMSIDEMLDYLYEYLPEDIVVRSMKDTTERFHARYNVKSKTYVYRIYNDRFRNVFNRKYAYHSNEKLNLDDMKKASEVLIGTHDFQSFTSLKSNSKSTVRTINYINITENDGMIEVEVNGNGFLWNMVRIIVGTLLEVGVGKLNDKDVERILDEKKRAEAGPIAQAKGLCLKNVQY
ncbi:tRNA pseudouridine(38-40) synthase TruA [Clostridium sp. 'White wine YQ']|uniref:tRNA pseudouridine(38-40) synthase TruA n=1 Tax=Clostridium sp. 'White wine YQ' TaxID=3027474 RepID=UPI002366C2B4|nr:tRNA pseudouridine(38-40) synthase TruA [Clostridium sp. 'White wine YQ']MDD7795682.1 tRNA pseudouridine(38-40) synthase TruA [Clostridium sp. 'White wine YQ']